MQITTYRPAVVIVDPERANAIVSIVAGPFDNDFDAREAYNAAVDANDAAYDAGKAEFVWYQIRHIETVITIADAEFADDSADSNDRPAEAQNGGTFGARIAEFAAQEQAPAKPVSRIAIARAVKAAAPSARASFFPTHINVLCTSAADRDAVRSAVVALGAQVDREWTVNRAYYITFNR